MALNSLNPDDNGNPVLNEIAAAHAKLSPPAQAALSLVEKANKTGPVDAFGQTIGTQENPTPAPIQVGRRVPSLMPSGAAGGSGPGPMLPGRAAPSLSPTPPAAQQPQIAPMSPHQSRLAQLTAAPPVTPEGQPDTDLTHTRQNTGASGINQIHNPWARIPLQIADALGGAFFPGVERLIPGTEGHHALAVDQAANHVKQDEAQETEAAKNKLTGAQTEEVGARTGAEKARADQEEALAEKARSGTVSTPFELWQKQNPQGKASDWLAEEAKSKPQIENEYKDFKEGYQKQHPDAPIEEVIKKFSDLKAASKEGNDFEQYYKQYLGDNKLSDSAANRLKAEQQFATAKQPAQRAPITNVFVPDEHGGYTEATVKPGQHIAPGAVSMAGMNSANTPTSATRTMAETAPKVLELADRVGKLVDEQAKDLGPAASRWNEFMAGKVGAPNPEFTKLRTDVGLLQTALMRMHIGARGGEQMMDHFRDLIDTAKQSPENLRAALGEIQEYAKAVQNEGKRGDGESHTTQSSSVDPMVKAYAVAHFGGDVAKAQAAIDSQKK